MFGWFLRVLFGCLVVCVRFLVLYMLVIVFGVYLLIVLLYSYFVVRCLRGLCVVLGFGDRGLLVACVVVVRWFRCWLWL